MAIRIAASEPPMPMDTDDLAPPPKAKPIPLDTLSIEELEDRISALEAEIDRAREMIAKKKKSRDAAASVFKR
jgi:uncharacterized small protein (DUF1192 family)